MLREQESNMLQSLYAFGVLSSSVSRSLHFIWLEDMIDGHELWTST